MLGKKVTRESKRALTIVRGRCQVRRQLPEVLDSKRKSPEMPATMAVHQLVQTVPELEQEQSTTITGAVFLLNYSLMQKKYI